MGYQVGGNNLPLQLTSFIAREQELALLRRVGESERLVTLVGPGGVGKSRLALEAARQGLPRHPNGAWLVDLAGLADPALVAQAVASTLGVVEGPLRSLEGALELVLRECELMLVLDNCEHVIDTCAELVETLLRACPRLHVLATSRKPLRVGGEQLVEVLPLAVPAEGEHDLRRLQASEAARLFAERARAVRPNFALTNDTSEAVAAICRRLDGIPLALELAAARLRVMSVVEIVRGLEDRFGLLASGNRTAQPRHRTLRGLVDWSWDQLNPVQQVLLRRLAVFAGGWTQEAAAQVCVGDALSAGEVASVLGELVDRSLVVLDDWRGSARHRLLDTIRAYAGERLREAGEEAAVRRRHQDWYLTLLESSDSRMMKDELGWLRDMDAELENLRVAMDWCRTEPSTAERTLRASPCLWIFWDGRGHANESRRRFEELLNLLPPGPPTAGRVIGQSFLAYILGTQGEFARAVSLIQETIALRSEVEDRAASFWCGLIELQYLVLIGDSTGPAVGRAKLAEQQQSPMPLGDTFLPWDLGILLFTAGELDEAKIVLERAAEIASVGRIRAWVVDSLGIVAYRRGDRLEARRLFRQALVALANYRDLRGCAMAVEHMASVAGALESWGRAARLLGAADALYDQSSQVAFPAWQLEPDKIAAACLQGLGEKSYAAAVAAGRAMSVERALKYALEPDPPGRRARHKAGRAGTTPGRREVDSGISPEPPGAVQSADTTPDPPLVRRGL